MGNDKQFQQKNGNFKLSKNQSVKIYKQKQSKIEIFKKEVEDLRKQYEEFNSQTAERFEDFPLSGYTKRALRTCNYLIPTEIQKETIGLALKGHDILGAAKTGSGKTLAFVIPILENLYCSGWSILDGLGALIITPTRELAYQIFEVMNKVGANHTFSVALVIGGKDLAIERKLLDKVNILICTPGRLLHHMDENPLFDSTNLKVLVLDEADRILDLGFEKTMNAILENLPQERQTLLFSATQTKSVKDLARLSLKNPVYVSVDEHARYSTPEALQQSFVVCEAHLKMNLLFSFIKNHKQQKTLVFMSTCKQVKFTFESICRLRPGISIMALYGGLHQLRRMQIYDEFCRKNHAVLLATDIAARGLDFPNVNWVVQLDCPEDVNTYIHRVGRTARFRKGGEALLVLLPSEKESMVEQLKKRKIPLEEIKVNPSKIVDIRRKLEAICARDVNLKNSGQRAFKTYLKNIFLMKDKSVFDVTKIDAELYAKSLGLAFPPRIRFLEKHLKSKFGEDNSEKNILDEDELRPGGDSENESEDDLLKPKNNAFEVASDEDSADEKSKYKKPITKAAVAKKIRKKKLKPNIITKFDEDGKPIREVCGQQVPVVAPELQRELLEQGYNIEKAKLLKEKEDLIDRMLFKEKIKAKHREDRLKRKKERRQEQGGSSAVLKNEEEEESSADDIDPNAIPLSVNESDSEQSVSSEVKSEMNEDSDHSTGLQRKRKMSDVEKKEKKFKVMKTEEKSFSSKHTLEDDEQLALNLLSTS